MQVIDWVLLCVDVAPPESVLLLCMTTKVAASAVWNALTPKTASVLTTIAPTNAIAAIKARNFLYIYYCHHQLHD